MPCPLSRLLVLVPVLLLSYVDGASAVQGDSNRAIGELSSADWAGIRAAHEASVHAAQPVDAGFEARSPAQGWRTSFDGRGFVTRPERGEWSWGLALARYGFAGGERTLSVPRAAESAGERVVYHWDGNLEEWYVNGAWGLYHGFTLADRPVVPHSSECEEPGLLRLLLDVRGDLRAEPTHDGRDVHFTDDEGNRFVAYTGLVAFDANGRTLPSRFTATADGLLLTVDERGAEYPLTIDPLAQQAYLKASNTGADDEFGNAVAISGDTAVVGARVEASSATGVGGNEADDSALLAGAAYVFVRNGSTWSQQAYLKASNTEAGDAFGTAVAISVDTIVVGARNEASSATGVNGNQADNSAVVAGAAYVFVRNGTTWSQEAYLKASNTEAFDAFGETVAISGDTIVVGALSEDSNATGVNGNQADNSQSSAGAAYVFVRSGTTWSQEAYLKASNTESNDDFGSAVTISGDTLVVGAVREGSSATGVNGNQADNSALASGAAYVFVRSGTTWSQQAYLKASNTDVLDIFGGELAIDGDTLVVGAVGESSGADGVNGNQADNSESFAGAAYVFTRSGTSWSQEAYLKASNSEGDTVVFGTPRPDGFGSAVSISGDTIAIGASGEGGSAPGINGDQSDNAAEGSGAAYVFVRTGSTWNQQAYVKASNPGTGEAGEADAFGAAIDLDGETLVVGAPSEDSDATGINGDDQNDDLEASGAAYVFERGCPSFLAAEENVRLGTPPNANALLPGLFTKPILGTNWNPVIDHTTFLPTAAIDVLGLSVNATNISAPPFGTILCDAANLIRFKPPGEPFNIPIPLDCSLVGATQCVSGASLDLLGNFEFTNALDIVIGTF